MSHSDDLYDHKTIEHHDPSEGFDRSEPATGAIWGFTIGSVVVLALVIGAVQGYFEDVYNNSVQQKILAAPSAQLDDVRNRDAWNSTHYMYGNLDPKSGRVRIPVERAMQLFADEAKAGKTFYPGKATAPKKDDLPSMDATGAVTTASAAASK
jgi:hypothetical protein